MVSWYKQRIAINEDTGQTANVVTGLSEWSDELYPTLFWEHFNSIPNFNTFRLVFDKFVTLEELQGQDGGENNG